MAKTDDTQSEQEQEKVKDATVEELLTALVIHNGPERTLGLMLQIINGAESRGSDLEIGVTLLVNGRLMTGRLIGAKKYYKEFGRLWTKSMTDVGDEGNKLAETFTAMGEDMSRAMSEATERLGPEDPRVTPAWINLEGVKILYPGPELTLNGPFRIRVSAIDGLTLGTASRA